MTVEIALNLVIFLIAIVIFVTEIIHADLAAIGGASLMFLTRCLSIEEAYRSIEWKAVFLIAAMLPMGLAMQSTGAASFIMDAVIAAVDSYGPTNGYPGRDNDPDSASHGHEHGHITISLRNGHSLSGSRQLYDPRFTSCQYSRHDSGRLYV